MRGGDALSLRAYGASPGSHAHDHHQVLVGLQGTLELEVAGRGRYVRPGDAVLVPFGEKHDFESASGSHCLVLDSHDALWSQCGIAPRAPAQVHSLALYLAQAVGQPLATLHGPSLLLEAWRPLRPAQHPRRRIDWDALAAWLQPRSSARSPSPNSPDRCTWAPRSSRCAATKRTAWRHSDGCGCSDSRARGSCATRGWR